MKAKLIEFAFVIATALVIVAVIFATQRIRAHAEMDEALLSLVKGQGRAQTEAK